MLAPHDGSAAPGAQSDAAMSSTKRVPLRMSTSWKLPFAPGDATTSVASGAIPTYLGVGVTRGPPFPHAIEVTCVPCPSVSVAPPPAWSIASMSARA